MNPEDKCEDLLHKLDKYAGEYNSIELYKVQVALIIANELLENAKSIWGSPHPKVVMISKEQYIKYWEKVKEELLTKQI